MKQLAFIIFLSAFSGSLFAQNTQKNILTFGFGAGIHGIAYKSDRCSEKSNHYGFQTGIGYKHLFKPKFGISTGLRFMSFSSSGVLDYIQTIDDAVDEDNKTYTHRTYFHGLEESQKQNSLLIPVEAVYVIDLEKKLKLQFDAGFFAGFSVGNNFKTVSGSLETRRFYYQQNLEVYGDYRQHHLYTESDFKGKYKFKPSFGGIFGAEFLYSVDKNFDLTGGFYGSLTMTSTIKKSGGEVYDPDCKASDAYSNTIYNGVLNTDSEVKTHPFSFGVMIGFEYTF